ncbi:uncharacterized protein BJX67DRAFT_381403 [Aspergillus lucknowensis]|uniref:Uncharacterized protein n=1 Tax=Aspergillus lucknowensis TaxID=176173 RepID=A0ABR4LRC9_9EURO
MTSAPAITALDSEAVGKPHGDLISGGAPQQGTGDDYSSKSAGNSTSTQNAERKPQDEPRPGEQLPAPANGVSDAPALEAKHEQPNVGVKRDLEATATANTADKPSVEQPTEPDAKKQKTSEDNSGAANGRSVPTQNGKSSQASTEKKTSGRPRKTKDTVRKDTPTDGIGSRTRSRTKVVP